MYTKLSSELARATQTTTMKPFTALIDCDYITYKACIAAECEIDFGNDVILVQSRFSEVMKNIENDLGRISTFLKNSVVDLDDESAVRLILCFSDSKNFRKEIDPDYKGHRNRKKPCGYVRAQGKLTDKYRVLKYPGLEADDIMGIVDIQGKIICSPDKDMRQIPGLLWDLNPENPIQNITPEEGWRWFLTQTLIGDQTDGYSGVPGIGKKKADDLLDKHGVLWDTVLAAFLAAGLTEEDALRNARLARILSKDDFDTTAGRPILWEPRGDRSGPIEPSHRDALKLFQRQRTTSNDPAV